MSTPFAMNMEDLARLWNEMIEQTGLPYEEGEAPEGIPEQETIKLHYPNGLRVPRNMMNFIIVFFIKAIDSYDRRLEGFLKEKNLL